MQSLSTSDMPAYANGQRYVSKNGPERERFGDPDASWRHRSAVSTRKGGGFYGYRIHASVCTATDLPVAWTVATAREHESLFIAGLLDTVQARGFAAETCALDKRDARRSAPTTRRRLANTGTWRFAGSDSKRGASKWRCPTGECKPASVWVKADRLHR